jgi:hypothetical protein
MRRTDRLLGLAGALLISTYFLALVWPSLHAYFVPDDMMNLYRSWAYSVPELVKANLLFFWASPFYRPLVSIWYRLVFYFAGFNPFPFHASYLVIFLVNLLLTYSLYRRLSGSRETAALATMLGSYCSRINVLYFDTSCAYDALCYTFYFSAFLLYVRVRQQHRLPNAWEMAACSLLYICALTSKEMAVTLPVSLLIYELLYHPVRAGEIGRWAIQAGRGVLVIGSITLVFVIGRLTGANSLTAIPTYRPTLTWSRLLETSGHFVGEMIGISRDWNEVALLALCGVLLLIAWLARSRVLWFALLFVIVSPLPIAFVPARPANQYYIPWFGWVLFGGTLLGQAIVYLTRKLPVEPLRLARLRGAAAVLVAMVILYPFYRRQGWANVVTVTLEGPMVRTAAEQIQDLYPKFPQGSRLLFLDDPLKADREDMIEIVRLVYRDTSLVVDRVKKMPARPDETQLASYDHVFDYRGGVFFELKRPWQPVPVAMIVRSPDRPEVYHLSWAPVTSDSPATVGEVLISQATGLGVTEPPVPEGLPFPRDPLLPVANDVVVYVSGKPARVTAKIGWPEKVNTYRVDFRIPEGTRRGLSTVQIFAGRLTGPVVRIPVR